MMNGFEVKDWMLCKMARELDLPHLFHLDLVCGIKETEKAVYGLFYTGYTANGKYPTRKCAWVPKSAIEGLENLVITNDYDEAVKIFQREYNVM